MKHTPAPWKIYTDSQGTHIVHEDKLGRETICTMQESPHTKDNAYRLIASANLHDEMVEALRDVEEAWAGNGDMATAIDAVLLVLAKAKGREQHG